jgi:FKBP-type peptidyl-prolyl cis-trans isomerase
MEGQLEPVLIDCLLSNLFAERQFSMKAKSIVTLSCLCLFSIYTSNVEGQTKRGRTPRISSAAITTPSGLTYLITKKGTGPQLKAGDTVILNYTGTLTNGVKFDSSYDSKEPLEFKLGTGRVIKGYDEGIAKLHVGDHAILLIPGKLAYGPKGIPNVIPPNSTLIFIIEVIDVKAESSTSP